MQGNHGGPRSSRRNRPNASKKAHNAPHTSIKVASPTALKPAIQRVATYLGGKEWLPTINPYKVDCVAQYRRTASSVQDPHLEDYLVAAVPIHCMDGWAYLSRALQSQIAGDSARALHLAYYAELRAALSLLGARGIGVLNDEHVIIDSSGMLRKRTGQRTHRFAWKALREWSTTQDAAQLLGRAVQYQGITLADWLSEAGLGGVQLALTNSWFEAWGADLQLFEDDRDARNLYSYSPTTFNNPSEATVRDIDLQLRSFWQCFEPAGSNTFAQLDRYLVRSALRRGAVGVGGQLEPQMSNSVGKALKGLGLDGIVADLAKEFLLPVAGSPEALESWILDRIADTPKGSSQSILPGLIARATLLLRLATAAAKEIVDDGNWTKHFQFWIDGFGVDSGLWDPNLRPASLTDLRADIEAALTDLSSWLATSSLPDIKENWQRGNAASLRTLSSAQLVGLWGLAG